MINLILVLGSCAIAVFTSIFYALWLSKKNLPADLTEIVASTPPVLAEASPTVFKKVIPPMSPEPHLTTMCTAICDYEGGPHDANHLNNNPGNARYNKGGYLPKYGTVRRSAAGFAIFPTRAQGWAYLEAMVFQMAKKHPQWTFVDFFSHYAPTTDGNEPDKYAKFVALRCGVPVNSTVASYLA